MAREQRDAAAHRGSFWFRVARSFPFAIRGMVHVVQTQRNAKVHLLATVAVISAGAVLRVTTMDWCLLVLAMGLVWTTESVNTAIERLADAVHPGRHPLVGIAKDVAAGAVLFASLAAAAVGLMIFIPRILEWVG